MAERIALLIGNSEFDDAGLSRLSAPWDDVVGLEKALRNVGAFETTSLVNAGLIEARSRIANLFKHRSPDDLILLYYTGHGLRDEHGDLYFALSGTDITSLSATGLEADYVRKEMNRSYSQRQVLILDCCHSGAFVEIGAKGRGGTNELRKDDFVDPGGHGRFVLAASAANESAFERDGKSLFTRHLVDALADGAAAPEKAEITINDLHTYLCRRVSKEQAPMQPHLWAYGQTAPLVIAHNPNPRKPLPAHLLDLLWDKDPYRARWAATQLIEIYQGPDATLAASAKKALQQRLEKPDDLVVLVADPIRTAFAHVDALNDGSQIAGLEKKVQKERDAREAAEASWRSERQQLETQIGELREQLEQAGDWLSGHYRYAEGTSGLDHATYRDEQGHDFHAQQHPLSRLWIDSPPLLRKGFVAWANASFQIEAPEMEAMKPFLLLYRQHVDDWLCVGIGEQSSYATWFEPSWAKSSIGRFSQDDPAGNEFNDFISKAYAQIFREGGVRLDHVYAQIPRERGGIAIQVNYQRLLLGCVFPDGDKALAVLVARTNRIEIDSLDPRTARPMPEELLMEFDI